MKVEFQLKRQIGDYILNVYLLHIFLLALCVASFWISISNIVIRMSLSIIILIIIKFQTIQTLKDERHVFSALSVWTFGLSCLVILSLLCHILSYYSVQHKWNDKILNRLIKQKMERNRNANDAPNRNSTDDNITISNSMSRNVTTLNSGGNGNEPSATNPNDKSSNGKFVYEMSETGGTTNGNRPSGGSNPIAMSTSVEDNELTESIGATIRQRWTKIKQNCLVWLNSIIVSNSRKHEGFDNINIVDILARVLLLIIYVLFILIYFCKYVF